MPSWFDAIVVSIMFISVVMAFFRGFVKEFFTIISWILSTLITIYLSPVVQKLFEIEEGKKAFYDAISVLIIFSLSMILFSFIFGRVIHHLKKNDGLFLDRSLGVLFGLVRGSLFVCLGYIFVAGFIYDEKPDWIKGDTVKIVELGSKHLIKLNPKNMDIDFSFDRIADKFEKDTKDEVEKRVSRISRNKDSSNKSILSDNLKKKMDKLIAEEEDGYSKETRKQVEDLIKDDLSK
jgi:membrane protein required for colicin V production